MTPPDSRIRRESRAFTLIELLVVIAIIAILAAILFPVFAKARERAKVSACISNQKQLALAVFSYADDADGKMPYGVPFADGHYVSSTPWRGAGKAAGAQYPGYAEQNGRQIAGQRTAAHSLFFNQLDPYVKTKAIFQCPSDKSGLSTKDASGNPAYSGANVKDEISYRFNPYASGAWRQDGSEVMSAPNAVYRPLSISQCAYPSEFALFRERFTDNHWDKTTTDGRIDYKKSRSPQAMADGSVKMRRGGLSTAESPWLDMDKSFWWTGKEPVGGFH